ncbi:MAG: hypothetical protein RLO17_20780 [Cyclobacteriaceae bacterium]
MRRLITCLFFSLLIILYSIKLIGRDAVVHHLQTVQITPDTVQSAVDKKRLKITKKGEHHKTIPLKKPIKVWLSDRPEPLKGRYQIIGADSVCIDSVVFQISAIEKVSTVNTFSMIGIASILGGSAYLLVIPAKFIASFDPVYGETKPVKNAGASVFLGLFLIAVGEVFTYPLLTKDINEKFDIRIE